MKVLVQWTRSTPRGWEQVDSSMWRSIPRRPDPTGMGAGGVDDAPGWVFGLCVQGVHFTADHYAVEPLPRRGCRVTVWSDDPAYYPVGRRNAAVWTFETLAPDPRFGRRWNTRQSVERFADAEVAADLAKVGIAARPYEDFATPDPSMTRHGKLVTDELNAAHDRMRAARGWREWTEGVPPAAIDARGRVSKSARG